MNELFIIYRHQEYTCEVEDKDTISWQIFSLTQVNPQEQFFYSENGKAIDLNDSSTWNGSCCPRIILCTSEHTFMSPHEKICTDRIANGFPIVQPAYQTSCNKTVCANCATSCFSRTKFIPNPNQKHLITDLQLISGDVDAEPPAGYEKAALDLNSTASGPYVYLCFRKGDGRPITHIRIFTSEVAEGYETLSISGLNYRIGYRKASAEQLQTFRGLALFDLRARHVDLDEVDQPSKPWVVQEWIRIRRNLHERVPGTTPIYLEYQLAAIGSVQCQHDGCQFRDPQHRIQIDACVPFFYEKYLKEEANARRARWAMGMEKMMAIFQRNAMHVRKYEDQSLQRRALECIPVQRLEKEAREDTGSADRIPLKFRDVLLHKLVRWFKTEFFTWTNKPKCSACLATGTTRGEGSGQPTPIELAYGGNRVELYRCSQCNAQTRFVRYNDPGKLLETRTGRCGEWANCFTLCCRAMGFDARYVYDVTDHVWTEVYSDDLERWLHCDPCENRVDGPLIYEAGWGKKLSYIFAFSKDQVVDVMQRYTEKWEDVLIRRIDVSEGWLRETLAAIDTLQLQNAMASPARREELRQRKLKEQSEFVFGVKTRISTAKRKPSGRISGSKEWRSSRQEMGSPDGNNKLECINEGADGSNEEVIRKLFQQLAVGCDIESHHAHNPFCSKSGTFSSTEEATAHAIQTLASINADGLSSSSSALECLLCSGENTFRWNLRRLLPILCWSLQETPQSTVLYDCSGSNQHLPVNISGLYRPIRLRGTKIDRAYGVEIRPGRHLSYLVSSDSPLAHLESKECTISFILRLDKATKAAPLIRFNLSAELWLTITSECYLSYAVTTSTKNLAWVASTHKLILGQPVLITVAVIDIATHQIEITVDGVPVGFTESSDQETPPRLDEIRSLQIGNGSSQGDYSYVICYLAVFKTVLEHESIVNLAKSVLCPPILNATRFFGSGNTLKAIDVPRSIQTIEQHIATYRVAQIQVWSTTFLNGFRFVYANEANDLLLGRKFCDKQQSKQETESDHVVQLAAGEILVAIYGRSGAWMDGIGFRTNFGQSYYFGGNGGNPFETSIEPGDEIRAIQAHCGDHIDNYRVLYGKSVIVQTGPVSVALKQLVQTAGRPIAKQAAVALTKYVVNLSENLSETKFHRIRESNPYFQENIGSHNDAVTALLACGFTKEESFLVYTKDATRVHAGRYQLEAFLSSL